MFCNLELARTTLWWPTAQPSDNLDYSIDLSDAIGGTDDALATVSLAIKPSGDGEMQALDLSAQAAVISTQLQGGVAGRSYTISITATTVSGKVFQYLVGLLVSPSLASYPLPVAPNPGFGTPINWTAGVTVFGPAFVAVQTGLTATGNNQSTAFLIDAQTSIFGTVAAGAGAVLPATIASGTCTVTNSGANDLLLYPPLGAAIAGYANDQPIAISPNQTVNFSAQNPTTEWFAQ